MFVAQALDRPDVEPTAVGPEEAARLLLTHACWSLVSSDVKRTKAGRELGSSHCLQPGLGSSHVVPTAWTEVLGLLVVRSRARARSPYPDHSVSCPCHLAPSLQASPEDHAARGGGGDKAVGLEVATQARVSVLPTFTRTGLRAWTESAGRKERPMCAVLRSPPPHHLGKCSQ